MDVRDPGQRERPRLSYGKRIASFRVIKSIGQGGYGDVYLVTPLSDPDARTVYAMKVELLNANKRALKREKEYMDRAQGCSYFPTLVAYGCYHRYRFMVIDMMGPSLSTLRRRCPDQKFNLGTVIRVGQVTLRIIREFHARGMIHRDIKASNFLVKPWEEDFLGLIDFGLSKFFVDESGEVIAPMEHAGFKGTLKYASPGALMGQDQGRRDDLFSWFYMLVELLTSQLPWGEMKGRSHVLKMKRKYGQSEEIQALPVKMIEVYRYIEKLGMMDCPDYEMIDAKLEECFVEAGLDKDELLAWEWISDEEAKDFSVFSLKRTEGEKNMFPISELVDPEVVAKAEQRQQRKLQEKQEMKQRQEIAIANRNKSRMASTTCILI